MVMDERNWRNYESGEVGYVGADHSTFQGASNLVLRLKEYWRERGEEIDLEIYHVANTWTKASEESEAGRAVWGVRARRPWSVSGAVAESLPTTPEVIGQTPRQRIKTIVASIAAKHGTTYEELMEREPGQRGSSIENVQNARHECVRAVHKEFPHITNSELGRIFHYVDQTTVGRILKAKKGGLLRPACSSAQIVAARRSHGLRALQNQFKFLKLNGNHSGAAKIRKQIMQVAMAA